MAVDNKNDAAELVLAGQYDHNLTNAMLDSFLEASSEDTLAKSYHFTLLGLSEKLNKALIQVGYMEKAAADSHIQQLGLTYTDICEAAKDAYQLLADKDKWAPARSPVKDSKTPYAKLAAHSDTANYFRAFALIQQQNGSSGKAKPDDVCLNCGEKGHWARDCPKKQTSTKNGGKRFGKAGKKPGNNKKHQQGERKQQSWKTTPPEPGAPQTMVKRGKTYHWCAHCGRWSTTHGTKDHQNEKTKKKLDNNPQAHLHFFPQPSAWHASASTTPTWLALLQLLGSWILRFAQSLGVSLLQLIVVCLLGNIFGTSGQLVGVSFEDMASKLRSTPTALWMT